MSTIRSSQGNDLDERPPSVLESAPVDGFAWNHAHPDALQRLPAELAHEIFRQLNFSDRIAASHVSRGWRATALADTFLWNTVLFAPRRLPVYYPRPGDRSGDLPPKRPRRSHPPPRRDILCELLARSDPVPFALSWENAQLPQDILDIVLQNLHRMQSLAIGLSSSGFGQFFALPAPRLLSLTCTSDSDDFTLPSRWDAPVLRKLELSIVRVPADGDIARLASVTHFNCFEMHGLWQRGINLFEVFPGLTSLSIGIVRPEMLPYLSNPPATLTELTLRTDDSPPIDYSRLLEACRTCQLKLLRLDSLEHLTPVMALFTSIVSGTWSLDIHRTGYRVGLASDQGGVSFSAYPEDPFSFAREPRLASYLSRVSALTAPVRVFAELDRLAQWNRCLPALRHITMSCMQTSNWPQSALPPVRAPILETVSVVAFGGAPTAASWAFDGLPAVLRSRFVYARSLLAGISIESKGGDCLSEPGLADLRALSETVRVNMGGETAEYTQ